MVNRLVRRLARLRDDTLRRAEHDLPAAVARVRAGRGDVLEAPVVHDGQDEIDEVAAAFDRAQHTALQAAAGEAAARTGFTAVFLNIAHRSQSIVHRQLKVLDEVERAETDPDQLARLFQLDHLATRERRNAENLIVLGGGTPGRQWREPVPLIELIRSAISRGGALQPGRARPASRPSPSSVRPWPTSSTSSPSSSTTPPPSPRPTRRSWCAATSSAAAWSSRSRTRASASPPSSVSSSTRCCPTRPTSACTRCPRTPDSGCSSSPGSPTGTGSASRCSSPRTAGCGPSSSSRPTCWPSRARRPTRGPPSTAPHHLPAGPRSPRTVPRRRRPRCRAAGPPLRSSPAAPLPEPPGTRPPSRSQSTRLGPSCRNGGGWTTSSLSCPTDPLRPARRATNQPPVPTAHPRTSTRVPAARGTPSARCSAERVMRAGPTRAAATAARRHDVHR